MNLLFFVPETVIACMSSCHTPSSNSWIMSRSSNEVSFLKCPKLFCFRP